MTTPEKMSALTAAEDQAETRCEWEEDIAQALTEITVQMQNMEERSRREIEEMQARLTAMQASDEPQLQQQPIAESNLQQPIAAESNLQQPIAAESNLQQPIAESNLQQPIAEANLQQPIAASNVQQPIAESNLQPNNDTQQRQPPRIAGPEERKVMHQSLLLFLHAHNCQRRENQANGEQGRCDLRHCGTMKYVLKHISRCKATRNCKVSRCCSSRKIVGHWKNCTLSDCPACLPIKEAARNWRWRTGGQAVVDSADSGAAAAAGNQAWAAAATSVANIRQQLFGFNEAAQLGIRGQGTNRWRQSITPIVRNHLAQNIVQAIYPNSDPQAMLDNRMRNLVLYARKVEGDMYEAANSRSEYYRLIAEKIYKLQNQLKEKREARREQQEQQELGLL